MLVAPYKNILDILVKVLGPVSQIVIKNKKSIQLTKWWQLLTTTYVELSKLVVLHLSRKTTCNNSTSELFEHVLSYAHRSSRCAIDFGKDHTTWCYQRIVGYLSSSTHQSLISIKNTLWRVVVVVGSCVHLYIDIEHAMILQINHSWMFSSPSIKLK
jgi:hypothetical protein